MNWDLLETDNNDLQNMLNDQLYKFYNLDFIILMTSHEYTDRQPQRVYLFICVLPLSNFFKNLIICSIHMI